MCNSDLELTRVNVPHVLSYLSNELAAMNVKLTFKTEAHNKHGIGTKQRVAMT